MDERETVSLTRLMLLWTAGVALCAVTLGDEVFLLPVTLFVSTTVCVVLLVLHIDRAVWWVYGAIVAVFLLGIGLAQFFAFATAHLDVPWTSALLTIYTGLAIAAALVRRCHRFAYAVFLAVHVVLVVLLLTSFHYAADVQALLDGGAAALLRGEHPYAITVQGVYGPEYDWNYGPGVLVDGRIMYGYPYLPVPLLVVLPAHMLGDVRIALVIAMCATSLLIRLMATDRLGRLASVLVLVMPVSWAMNLGYWVEPVLLVLVAASARSMRGSGQGVGMWFGCFLASKQYAVVHLPYLWLLLRAKGRRAVLLALAVPAILCLVFLLWDPAAFWHSAIEFHLRQPYRYDTVTLTPALERALAGSPEFLFGPYGLLLGGCVSVLIAWRCRPDACTFAAGIGLSLAISVLFSKQGHTNYWGLIGGALLIAVVTYDKRARGATGRWHTPVGDVVEPLRPRPRAAGRLGVRRRP